MSVKKQNWRNRRRYFSRNPDSSKRTFWRNNIKVAQTNNRKSYNAYEILPTKSEIKLGWGYSRSKIC